MFPLHVFYSHIFSALEHVYLCICLPAWLDSPRVTTGKVRILSLSLSRSHGWKPEFLTFTGLEPSLPQRWGLLETAAPWISFAEESWHSRNMPPSCLQPVSGDPRMRVAEKQDLFPLFCTTLENTPSTRAPNGSTAALAGTIWHATVLLCSCLLLHLFFYSDVCFL